MTSRLWVKGTVLTVAAGIGLAAFLGCQQGRGGGGRGNNNANSNANVNANDNITPPPPGQFATGAILDPDRFENLPQAINPFAAAANQSLPSAADNAAGFAAIGDQGQLGSCTAWAAGYAGATYSANRQFQWGAETLDHQASPGYLYAKLVEADAAQGTSCGTGTLIATAMNLLVQGGCSSFQTVGYSDSACQNPDESDAANFRIGSFKRVEPQDRNGVKAEIAAGNAVVIGAKLYTDFMTFTGDGVFTGNGEFLTQNNQHAAHAMAVVGYDDGRGAYRIRNSWGTGWGDAGSMWMDFDTFEATVFEVYALLPSGDREPPNPEPGPGPGPDPEPTEDPEGFLDDAFQFAVEDPFTGVFTVYLVFYYHFESAVLIHNVTVTAPDGTSGVQTYETWFADGYVAFGRVDGLQWIAGTYEIVFDTTTQAGNNVTYTGLAEVASLDDGGFDEGNCSNFCTYAFDGECDDGGPGSQFSVCEFGTDCGDCGPRDSGADCDDSCVFAFDGICDEGFDCDFGTDCSDCGGDFFCDDSCEFALDGVCDEGLDCDFGTDCTDCEGGGDFCDDSCEFAFDGVCDEGFDCDFGTDCTDCEGGGTGCDDSCEFALDGACDEPAFCELGTDCTDCEVGGTGCDDSCEFAFDGACDDGGVGSITFACEFGTDCFDCGPRESPKAVRAHDRGARAHEKAVRTHQRETRAREKTARAENKALLTPYRFRGIPVKIPARARTLPAAGVIEGTLGENGKPLTILSGPTM